MKVFLQKDVMNRSMKVYITQNQFGGKLAVALPMELEFKEHDENQMVAKPTLDLPIHMGIEVFQELADSLFDEGFIPSQLTGKQKQAHEILEAKEAHLQDMRRIVFKKPEEESSAE